MTLGISAGFIVVCETEYAGATSKIFIGEEFMYTLKIHGDDKNSVQAKQSRKQRQLKVQCI